MRPDKAERLYPDGELPAGQEQQREPDPAVVRLPEAEPDLEGVLPASPDPVSAEPPPENENVIRLPNGILSDDQLEYVANDATDEFIISEKRKLKHAKYRLKRLHRKMRPMGRVGDIKKPPKHRIMLDPKELQKYLSQDMELNRLKDLHSLSYQQRLEIAKEEVLSEKLKPTRKAMQEIDRQIKEVIDHIASLPRDREHRHLVTDLEKLTLAKQALLRKEKEAAHGFKYPRALRNEEVERDIRARVHRLTAEYAFSPIRDAKLKIRKIFHYWGKVRPKYRGKVTNEA